MPSTLSTLLKICFLQASPQDLPSSGKTLYGCIVFSFVTILITANIVFSQLNVISLTITQILLLGLIWYGLLKITNKLERWTQSATAVFGTAGILNLISLPVFMNSEQFMRPSPGDPVSVAMYAATALFIWDIAVNTRIVRETIEVRTSFAVGISLVIRYISIGVIGMLFGLSG